MAQYFVGTSGWNYAHWRNLFYPEGTPQRAWLEYYSTKFRTAEVNYSFYKLPKPSTYERWLTEAGDDFTFALKCSRLITHAKRLGGSNDLWRNFLTNALFLQEALGPILIQLPERFESDPERLKAFLSTAESAVELDLKLRFAVEFRHDSWFTNEVFKILEHHNAALCIADSSRFPRTTMATADFVYYRFHGPTRLFGSQYTDARLDEEAQQMQKFLKDGHDVYAYFNNDAFGFAIKNAATLQRNLDALAKSPKRKRAS